VVKNILVRANWFAVLSRIGSYKFVKEFAETSEPRESAKTTVVRVRRGIVSGGILFVSEEIRRRQTQFHVFEEEDDENKSKKLDWRRRRLFLSVEGGR